MNIQGCSHRKIVPILRFFGIVLVFGLLCISPVSGLAVSNQTNTGDSYFRLGEHVWFWPVIAWADWDADGDMDLAIAELFSQVDDTTGIYGSPVQVWENVDGQLFLELQQGLGWASTEELVVTDLEWGDWDNDGDLDLAVAAGLTLGQGGYDRVYENEAGILSCDPVHGLGWEASSQDHANEIAWGDWDGDGDLDLAIAHQPTPQSIVSPSDYPGFNQVWENQDGTLQLDLANGLGWQSTEEKSTNSIAWGDFDGDGDLDLAEGNVQGGGYPYEPPLYIRENISDTLQLDPDNNLGWWGGGSTVHDVAWIDWDMDGDLDLSVSQSGTLVWSGPGTTGPLLIYENVDGNLIEDPPNGFGWNVIYELPNFPVGGTWIGATGIMTVTRTWRSPAFLVRSMKTKTATCA